jgi:hypothetical protein
MSSSSGRGGWISCKAVSFTFMTYYCVCVLVICILDIIAMIIPWQYQFSLNVLLLLQIQMKEKLNEKCQMMGANVCSRGHKMFPKLK